MRKILFIFFLVVLFLFFPGNVFAQSFDYAKEIIIYNGDGSCASVCQDNPSTCLNNSCNNTKSFKIYFAQEVKPNVSYTVNFVFRLYVDKGTIPPQNFETVYSTILGNTFDSTDLLVVNQRLDNSPETSDTYFDTYRYQVSMAPLEANTTLDFDSYIDMTFEFPLTGQVSLEVIELNVSSGPLETVDPDYTGQLDDINKNQQATNDKLDDLNDAIKDDDVSGSKDKFEGYFNDIEDNDYGLSNIITIPLDFIKNLLGHSCTPFTFELPFVEKNVTLPCIKPIYQHWFGPFFLLWQTITTGMIAYSVIINIWATVEGLKDPQNDKIEVLRL